MECCFCTLCSARSKVLKSTKNRERIRISCLMFAKSLGEAIPNGFEMTHD